MELYHFLYRPGTVLYDYLRLCFFGEPALRRRSPLMITCRSTILYDLIFIIVEGKMPCTSGLNRCSTILYDFFAYSFLHYKKTFCQIPANSLYIYKGVFTKKSFLFLQSTLLKIIVENRRI